MRMLTWQRVIAASGVELLTLDDEGDAVPFICWRDGGTWHGTDRAFIARADYTQMKYDDDLPPVRVSMWVGATTVARNRYGERVVSVVAVKRPVEAMWKTILREAHILALGG